MAGRERTTSVSHVQSQNFLPPKTPDVIKKMIPVVIKLKKDGYRKLLQVIVKHIEGHEITEDIFEKLRNSFASLSEERFLAAYTGLLALLQYAFRHPKLKKETFHTELMELRFTEDLIEDIGSIVFSERYQNIEKNQLDERLRLPTLSSLRWRVDVTISTSVLNRVLEPTILMQTTDSEGKVTTFEVSQAKFHELRYNVAQLLKDMEDLEKRSILKV